MAERGCAFLLNRIESDPVLRSLPYGAQMVWVRLTLAMAKAGASILRIGSHVPSNAEVGAFASIPAAEMGKHLLALERSGLLSRDADGALVNPALVITERRAEAARINGRKGGRPRKHPAHLPQPGAHSTGAR